MISTAPTTESCPVPPNDTLFQRYHDLEWGVPTRKDQSFYEKVCLEGFQSGLSWRTILHRRDGFRDAFSGFDPEIVAAYTDLDVERLMQDERIIRNRRKILSAINNAQRALELATENGSLADFFWQFEPPLANRPEHVSRGWLADNPHTDESIALAKALKKRGWSFVGPVNMYALMQALGIVNDHVNGCPCRSPVDKLRTKLIRTRKTTS